MEQKVILKGAPGVPAKEASYSGFCLAGSSCCSASLPEFKNVRISSLFKVWKTDRISKARHPVSHFSVWLSVRVKKHISLLHSFTEMVTSILEGGASQVVLEIKNLLARQCRRHKRGGFDPWAGKTPWRRKRQPTPVLLSGQFHGQRSLVGYSPWGHKVGHD